MARSALEDVSEATYTALNVSAMTALATGGVYEDPPQGVNFPFVWFTVREDDTDGTFSQVFKNCRIAVHGFSQYQGSQEVQTIMNKAVDLLRHTTPSLDNHTSLLLTHESTTGLPDEEIAGVKTKHAVAEFRLVLAED